MKYNIRDSFPSAPIGFFKSLIESLLKDFNEFILYSLIIHGKLDIVLNLYMFFHCNYLKFLIMKKY